MLLLKNWCKYAQSTSTSRPVIAELLILSIPSHGLAIAIVDQLMGQVVSNVGKARDITHKYLP